MSDYISRDAAKQILSTLLVKDAAECACNLVDCVLPADVEPVRRWIPCSERMPDLKPCNAGTAYSEAVNVWTTGRKIMVGIWDGTDWIAPYYFWEAWDEQITHWMPLSEPPEEEQ